MPGRVVVVGEFFGTGGFAGGKSRGAFHGGAEERGKVAGEPGALVGRERGGLGDEDEGGG